MLAIYGTAISERLPFGKSGGRERMEAIDQRATPPSAQDNINTVVAIEEEAQLRRTLADRVSDLIANFVGSMPFLILHL